MPGLGLGHDSRSSYHESKTKVNGTINIHDTIVATGNGGSTQQLKDALPKVRSLPNSASVDEVVDALKITGGVIIRDAVSHGDIDIIES